MRKLAWLVVLLLFLLSALFFVRYAELTAAAARPEAKMLLELGQVLLRFNAVRQAADAFGNLRGVTESADFALYASIGFAWLVILSIVLLAATHRRRHRLYDDDSDGLRGGPDICPKCGERFRGFEITCRACGASLVAQARRGRR